MIFDSIVCRDSEPQLNLELQRQHDPCASPLVSDSHTACKSQALLILLLLTPLLRQGMEWKTRMPPG